MLVIAHPGHELRAFAWMLRSMPEVWILTDGSGRKAVPRIDTTRKILEEHNATVGSWFGVYNDLQVYEWVLARNAAPFVECAITLAGAMKASGTSVVVGDAMEGRIMSHDVLRIMVNAAVLRCRLDGQEIASYDFLLDAMPRLEATSNGAIKLELSPGEFAAKYEAAQNYEELGGEVRAALQKYGETPFRVEVFEPVSESDWIDHPWTESPYYELHGEEQVRQGNYPEVIRFREHVLPLMRKIWTALNLPLPVL